jgi:hypothetical protein
MDGELAPRPTRVAVQDRVAGEFGQARQRVLTARPVTQQPPQELAGFSYLVRGGGKLWDQVPAIAGTTVPTEVRGSTTAGLLGLVAGPVSVLGEDSLT